MTAARMIYRLIYQSNFNQSFLFLRVCFPQENSARSGMNFIWDMLDFIYVLLTTIIIITITNSSNIIDTFAASFFTNNSVQLQSDSVIRQLAVIEQLKQPIILSPLSYSNNHRNDQNNHSNNHLSNVINKSGIKIGLPLRGRPILLITRMITDRIGLHQVLLPLLITMYITLYIDYHEQ